MNKNIPRIINPTSTFNALVDWFHNQLIVHQNAPGFLVGLSGTDSLVAFCAAAKALEKAGKADRMFGVHFAPSEDFLYDNPEASTHLWFQNEVLPWLTKQFPQAKIIVDTSIDWRCDGLRWGALMDLSVISNERGRRMMRLPEDQFWVVGTRNRTENELFNYSSISAAASLQPLIHLWKSEILQLSEHLGIPKIAITKSCETDCICGRMQLPAQHIPEVDALLMHRCGELSEEYIKNKIQDNLRIYLSKYINSQIITHQFKNSIPYQPECSVVNIMNQDDLLISAFEDSSLNIKEFNHYKHLYIAWFYLKFLTFESALDRYIYHLKILLEKAGQSNRFNADITRLYFERIDETIKNYSTNDFDELIAKVPDLIKKI